MWVCVFVCMCTLKVGHFSGEKKERKGKMAFDGGQYLMRSALGRVGFVGELYDARSESFASRCLFKRGFSSRFVECVSTSNTSFDYKFTQEISERFDLLNVEAEIQVSLLCGLFEAEGCGKFLAENRSSGNAVSCSLLCQFQTVCEKVFGSFEEMVEFIDLSALEDSQCTHVVVEINWGANCVLNLEQKLGSESQKKEVEGVLGAKVQRLVKMLSGRASGEVTWEEEKGLRTDEVRVKVVADVLPDGELPTTVNSFCRFLSKVAQLLQNVNGGKGKPLNYAMIPLDSVRKSCGVWTGIHQVVRSIDESFLVSVVCLFEEISMKKEKVREVVLEFSEFERYLASEAVLESKKHLESLRVKEYRLKSIIADEWVSVRSGRNVLGELMRRLERFRARELNLFEYEEYLNSTQTLRKKIATVKNFVSHGAEYLEKGNLITEEFHRSVGLEFVILLLSEEYQNSDLTLYHNTCHYFLSMIPSEVSATTRYIVVDLNIDVQVNGGSTNITNRVFFSKLGISTIRCMHFKGGQLINADMYRSYLWERTINFARIKTGSKSEIIHHRPGQRVALEIACPGHAMASCPSEKLKWHCVRCKQELEYGFDEWFYCSCGRGSCHSYEYRCAHEAHGPLFFQEETKFLLDQLSGLRPLKELNVLVLGQSGVGKSTWINSIVNYLSYESLEEAKENGVICTIPIQFSAYDRETAQRQDIRIGDTNENEQVTQVGTSGTQSCSTYCFLWQGRYIRIIDTPGIGDTRGIDQDKENMRNIIDHVCHLKELHGICILMKANDCRINAIFSYCFKELLIHMHKSVTRNIVFCFTNARNSFYTPGQTSVLLEKQLQSLQLEKHLSLGHHNRFCLDNEAFLFLCTLNYPNIRHDETLIRSFAQSWQISLNETLRLFSTIADFKPHSLQETSSLFAARNKVLALTRPIAEISKTIQMNLAVIAKRKAQLDASENTLAQLSQNLYHTEIHLEAEPLDLPRTVCTSPKCVRYHPIQGLDLTDIEYVTHCHKACYLNQVVPLAVNNALLRDCQAMASDGNCRHCGCHWSAHMHLTFHQKRLQKQAINKKVEIEMQRETSDKENIKNFLQALETKIANYQNEQDFIIQVSVKFGMFLKENAISVYNDAVSDYLKYLINEEQEKPHKTDSDENLLKNLKQTLDHYEAEVAVLQRLINTEGSGPLVVPTVKEIHDLEQKLYALDLSGTDIKKYADVNLLGSSAASSYRETYLHIRDRTTAPKKQTKPKYKRWIFF